VPFDRDAELDRLLARVHEVAALTAAPTSSRDVLFLDYRADSRVEPRRRLVGALRRCRSRWMGSASRRPGAEQGCAARAAGPRRTYKQEVARDTVWARSNAMHELDAFQARGRDLATLLREELRASSTVTRR
jgi:hypothetical protein